jgi:hypothetical protein
MGKASPFTKEVPHMVRTNRRTQVGRGWLIAGLVAAALLALAGPVAASAPIEQGPFVDVFPDVDPCSGQMHTVTISTTFRVHEHGDRAVAHAERTLTTTLGYEGGGMSAFVTNGQIEMFRFTDMITNETGDRIRATGVFVVDLRSDTTRVDRFSLTCTGQ